MIRTVADDRVDWVRCLPFLALHAVAFAAFFRPPGTTEIVVAAALFFARMFAVTAFYHRYFSHRTYRTSRAFQFMMALAGTAAVQRGPIWWAAHHRHHHAHADRPEDEHSPRLRGFLMSHMGWFMTPAGFRRKDRYVRDWLRYPELRFLDRFDWLAPAALFAALYLAGGWDLLLWGGVVSTVVLYHATYTINSIAHRFGFRTYDTPDDSRNSFLLALLTLGEGWHNNHHRYPSAVRQGFRWWQVDLAFYGLLALRSVGLIRDLKPVPESVRLGGAS